MCNIQKLYNKEYIINYLKDHKILIANVCDGYSRQTFEEYKKLYEKYTDDFLCDWFPSLWAIIFYKNNSVRRNFLESIDIQIDYDSSINIYSIYSNIQYEDNKVIVSYNNHYTDYITLEKEKNVG